MTQSARTDARINGFDDSEASIVVTVNNPPLAGPAIGDNNAVEVIVQSTVATTLLQAFGEDTSVVRARAVAAVGPDTAPLWILALHATEEGAITFNGTSDMDVPDCEIIARSNYEEAIEVLGGPCVTAGAIGYSIGGGYIKSASGPRLDLLSIARSFHRKILSQTFPSPTRTVIQLSKITVSGGETVTGPRPFCRVYTKVVSRSPAVDPTYFPRACAS